MSPLIPASFLADDATLPLPLSHEIRAPASATSPRCFRSKIVCTTRTNLRRLPAGEGRQIFVQPLPDTVVELPRLLVHPSRDQFLLHVPDPAVQISPSAPRGQVLVLSSVTTLRYTSSKRWKCRSLSDTTTKLVGNPWALASTRPDGP